MKINGKGNGGMNMECKKYKGMNNIEIRKITYEECPLKCTGSEALCEEMPVGQCRDNLSQKFDYQIETRINGGIEI